MKGVAAAAVQPLGWAGSCAAAESKPLPLVPSSGGEAFQGNESELWGAILRPRWGPGRRYVPGAQGTGR